MSSLKSMLSNINWHDLEKIPVTYNLHILANLEEFLEIIGGRQ